MKLRDIQQKSDVVADNLEKLSLLREKSLDDFSSDFRNVDSALHRLQTSIQALLDIGGYIIASLGLKTPAASADIIEILCEAGRLPEEKKDTYIKMSQFRNRIVHLYNRIDLKTVYDILSHELDDIKELYTTLIRVVNN